MIKGPIGYSPSGKRDEKNSGKDQGNGQRACYCDQEGDEPLSSSEDEEGEKEIEGSVDDERDMSQQDIIKHEERQADQETNHLLLAKKSLDGFHRGSDLLALVLQGSCKKINAHKKEGKSKKEGSKTRIRIEGSPFRKSWESEEGVDHDEEACGDQEDRGDEVGLGHLLSVHLLAPGGKMQSGDSTFSSEIPAPCL
jgi:hypothetical protein